MKKNIVMALLILLSTTVFGFAKPRVLVFSKTAGFHHESIAVGIPAVIKIGKDNNFDVDTTTNAALFTLQNLKRYKAVIFLSTTGDVLNDEQQAAFEQYIKQGGGFVGVHSATDTEYDWPWYGNLVGAYFKSHPSKQQEADLHVVDRKFIATKRLPVVWRRLDEWYNYKWIAKGLHILITIDEKSYTGGENGSNHPMSWYHNYDGGRAFYTALGHTDASYSEPLFLKHLLGGIKYAMGQSK
ncbi:MULTISPECIES: ThuA domain-containing protein [unclassified Mucilaginibacter]|uniref:ThuA domain-containing protein n=1 Tax=unclassified Mucilaginibacter TaxID=2617802 RepID=UPI0009617152|nr:MULTISPECIES: ThuA domain-containing protein [unclassified Mucilaginibacter]OJW18214.1 MAG: Crp/Fnr family transcriptional regulator [Mucilaginibacter sp. 44-25]PLW90456.1 MAG: Crp/Fnr family transcriptional regulator [Mucilaginibacter sp.]HEK20640.1 ThuA domain-containing protein [Bacteroidota bacterium]